LRFTRAHALLLIRQLFEAAFVWDPYANLTSGKLARNDVEIRGQKSEVSDQTSALIRG